MLISVAEAARLLDVNPSTVWRYIDAGELIPARPQKPYVLWQSSVIEFAPNAKKRPGPKPGTRPTPPPAAD